MRCLALVACFALLPSGAVAQVGKVERKKPTITQTPRGNSGSKKGGNTKGAGKKGGGKTTPRATPPVTSNGSTRTFTVNGVSFTMVGVAGGTFTMGATAEQGSDAEDDEKPTHSVTLSDYWIGQTEVTQELWQAVMGSNPSKFKGDSRPVECVSWEDCQKFISQLNRLTGQRFRLPTEAEWEYAARGGRNSRGYKYAGSNDLDAVAWYWKNSGDTRLSGEWDWARIQNNYCRTHPVGMKAPNELGLYDMSGNVWEWCADWYGSYTSSSQTNPTGPTLGSLRVFRGGWSGLAGDCRVSFRGKPAPTYRYLYLGLRLGL